MPAKTSGDANSGKLCWLHLSDIHFWAKNNWRDESARRKLLALLEERFGAGKLPRPDLVFCTGDIAQGETSKGAMEAQYKEAQAFFDRVLDICGLPKDRLYVVPGNHDVNRSRVSAKFQRSLVGASMAEIAADWAGANAEYQQAIARLTDYAQFVKDYLPHQQAAAVDEHGRQCYSRILNIQGIRLGIAGFNSVWTSFDDHDQNRLWLAAEWQFNQADGALDDKTDLRIGMMHHPASWLQMEDANLAKQRIRAGFHFWLHGHEHQAWVMPTDKEIVISAGAVNAGSAPEFGINLVQLDLTKGKGKVHLFSYKAGANAWLICPDGDAPDGVREIAFSQVILRGVISDRLPVTKKIALVAKANSSVAGARRKNVAKTISDSFGANEAKKVSGMQVQVPASNDIGGKVISTSTSKPSVFISYAWESEQFRSQVKALRTWLRRNGIDVISDFDHAIRPPTLGWQAWMQQSIEDAIVVLVVCSPKYKLRIEKRAPLDSGKGVTWEGAIITQDLYNAAQRNGKFYPIFIDPINLDDVPKLLAPWNNGHSYPSTKKNILSLISECFAESVDAHAAPDAVEKENPARTIAESVQMDLRSAGMNHIHKKIVQKNQKNTGGKQPQEKLTNTRTKKKSLNSPDLEPFALGKNRQDNSTRLQHARTQLLRWLAQADFAGISNLTYASDCLPEGISTALQAKPDETMARIADRTIDAVLNFARAVGKARIEPTAFASVAKRKAHLRHCLINAMQQAILLAARPYTPEEQAALEAVRANHLAELDVMSWLSISVLTRDELAKHLQVQLRSGDFPVFKESGLTEYPEDVEAGLFDPQSDGGAKLHAMKAAHKMVFPLAATLPNNPSNKTKNELVGELKRRKKDGNAIITTIAKSSGASSNEFIQWLKGELHLGVVLITENDGIFELVEGDWKSSLTHLYSALQTFEEPTT